MAQKPSYVPEQRPKRFKSSVGKVMSEPDYVAEAAASAVRKASMRYVIQGTSENDSGYGVPFGPPWMLIDAATAEPEGNWPGELVGEFANSTEASSERDRLIACAVLAAADKARRSQLPDDVEEAIARIIAGDHADEVHVEQGGVRKPEWAFFIGKARQIKSLFAVVDKARWRPIGKAPDEWKDGRELEGWDARMEVRSLIRWGKHNHVPLYGWIRQVELYGEEVDGFDPTHVRELPPPPDAP